ncbi:hypothetical protein BC940DRAFT_367886 [Gongronella butleri]|nr:hypothetical protein BC940DRAFT_367886 [Gongronella butleri]
MPPVHEDLTWNGLAIDDQSFTFGMFRSSTMDKFAQHHLAQSPPSLHDNESLLDGSQQSVEDLDTYFSDIDDMNLSSSLLEPNSNGSVMRLGRRSLHQDQGDWAMDLSMDQQQSMVLALKPFAAPDNDPFLQFDDDDDKTQEMESPRAPRKAKSVRFQDNQGATVDVDHDADHEDEEDNMDGLFEGLDIDDDNAFIRPPKAPSSLAGLGENNDENDEFQRFERPPCSVKPLGPDLAKYVEDGDEMNVEHGLALDLGNQSATATAPRRRKPTFTRVTPSRHAPRSMSRAGTVSRLPRPIKTHLPAPRMPPPPVPTTSMARPSKKHALLLRLTMPTYASEQKRATAAKPMLPAHRFVTGATYHTTATSSAGAYQKQRLRQGRGTHVSRPIMPNSLHPRTTDLKHGKYGNGSELDHLDDLPIWHKPSPSATKYLARTPPKPIHRQNAVQKKPTLIRLKDQPVSNEVNGMRFDAQRHAWQGNEELVAKFPAAAPLTLKRRRPALIKNMTRRGQTPSVLLAGDMKFDPKAMAWYKCEKGDAEEDQCLAHIADLHVHEPSAAGVNAARAASLATLCAPPSSHQSSSMTCTIAQKDARMAIRQAHGVTNTPKSTNTPSNDTPAIYFSFTSAEQQAMVQQEEEHRALFQHWPLFADAETMLTPAGYRGPQHCYVLY